MKLVIYLVVLAVCLNIVWAGEVEINTTLQIDDRGNDIFRIKVDGKTIKDNDEDDMNFNCTDLNETKFEAIVKIDTEDISECNASLTNVNNILEGISNMTNHCSMLEDQFNCSIDLVERIAAHERTVVRYEDCKVERSFFQEGLSNTSSSLDECETTKSSTTEERNTFQTNYDNCKEDLGEAEKKSSDNQMLIIVGLIGGGVGGYLFSESQKKKKLPGPMASAGHPGYQAQQNKPKWK